MCYENRVHERERMRDLRAYRPPPQRPLFVMTENPDIFSFFRFTMGQPYPPGYFDRPAAPTRLQRCLSSFVLTPVCWLGGVAMKGLFWSFRVLYAQVLPAVALFIFLAWLNYAIYGDDYDVPSGRTMVPLS